MSAIYKKLSVCAAAACLTVMSGHPYTNTAAVSTAADAPLRIMCIGDSITDGYTNDYTGSYRKFLEHSLRSAGFDIDMVGSKQSGWVPTYTDPQTGESFEFDNDYTGYSGYAIEAYSGRMGIRETLMETGCLAAEHPDIVTLQIGTNDIIDCHEMDKAGARLEVLVDYILENIPENSVLFLSTVTPLQPNRSGVYDWFSNYRHSPDWQTMYTDEVAEQTVKDTLTRYNSDVESVAAKKQAEGKRVVFADIGAVLTDPSGQLFDGVHPNNTGYKLMGERWAEVIGGYVGGGTERPSEQPFSAADLIDLSRYLHGAAQLSAEQAVRFDLDHNGSLNVFDLVLMRKEVASSMRNS